MLENWCWTPAVLKRISHHYSYISNQFRDLYSSSADGKSTPPEKTLPDELINNLIRTKHVNSATGNLRQLHFAIFDMKVHEPESPQAIKDLDLGVAWNTLGKEVTMLAGPETQGQGYKWGNGQAAFGHIGNDYDAGYYGYLRLDILVLLTQAPSQTSVFCWIECSFRSC